MKAKLWIVSPFETPDTGLVRASYAAGVFPVLHLGRDLAKAQEALQELALLPERSFGVAVTDGSMEGLRLPKQVATIVAPFGVRPPKAAGAQTVWQVHSVAEAGQALKKKAAALIIKGSEGAGLCGEESSFILFQHLSERCAKAGVALYVQGGVGVHTAAAYLALGAQGVILDSQVALMPECGTADGLRRTLEHLNGSEIKRCGEYRYYTRPGAPELDEDATRDDLFAAMDASDEDAYLPLGQDVILAVDYVQEYGRLRHLVRAIEQAAFSHLELARERNVLGPGNNMATMLGTTYPIAQGPMARISDVPEFLNSVAKGGGLPFLAMSMMVGPAAQKALTATSELLAGKPWGAGILGFTFPKIVEEQTKLILEAKPPVVLIAGGRPAQARVFEDAGIKVFLHVPAAGLLDMFLKEGARCFIFEGRESGGHVGPLYSTVLWEKQINRLLRADDKAALSVFFAGGIHDAHSAAFVSIMAAPLTARDVNVGVLAGTAYLYSNEIVSSGAITEEYRRLVIEKDYTVLLKSGAGQETRSVSSPFTDYFLSEKARLHKEGVQGQELLMKLEELNLGRLRVAAKGVERQGSELKELTAAEQVEGGLFMTGAVTSIIHTSTTIPAIHKDLSVKSRALISKLKPFPTKYDAGHAVDIAIVGMEGIFPDAENVDEYWRNILCGKNSMSEVDAERWEPTLFYDPDVPDTDHVPSKWGGFLGAIDFDAFEFGITPNSLASIEPVQLLSLLVAKRALADAGYTDLAKVDLDDTSVIFGAQGTGELSAAFGTRAGFTQFFGELPAQIAGILPVLTEDSFPGVLSNVIAGRISNRLNTGGRNFVVDAACASSLAALEIAVGQLASGSSNMVVLGGADLHNGITDFLMFASTYALSHKGRCSTFDADADGIALGEGVGVVILKRLEDAVNDGNKIYAVVKGTGGSSDGRSLGLTAPSKRGQVKALQRAYHNAGISPTQVGLVEAHGTGTVVGDRIELSALTDVFLDAGAKPAQAHLGSVKTQIGHTKCAAGVASLIKTALCVQHGLLPPTLNLVNPNDAYSKSSPFAFKTQKAGLWHQDQRIAAVSGFGFGGANFHAVLQNYEASTPAIPLAVWPSELFVFRGDTPQEAQELMDKVGRLHGANNKLKLKDIAYSLSRYSQKPVQYALTAGSWPELLQHLGATLDNQDDKLVHVLRPLEGKVAFLFPGQGSQRVNMAADLFVVFKQMRTLLDAHPEYEGLIFPNAVFTDDARKTQRAELTDTRNAQPALGIVDLAIAELLRNLGIEADVVAGHSYGELPALCFAGALDQDALVGLSHNRALSILDAVGDDAGGMAAVHTSREALDQLLADEDEVWAVNLNAPTQTVVAASTAGMEGFLKRLEEAKVAFDVLSVACAFHSPLLAGAQERFAQVLEAVTVKKPTLPVWSNTTAKAYPRTPAAIKARLAEHLVKPVRFVEEIEHMYEDGVRVFVETGPGAVLTGLAGKTLKGKDFAVIQTERGNTDGISYLLNGIAKYISTGREIKMENLFEGRDVELIDLDDAARYEKKSTVWSVSGYDAQPVVGERPAHAGKPLASLPASERQWGAYQSNNSVEAIMAAYLDNMNSLIQDQRDVMLGYLGQPELIPRATSAPRQFAYTQVDAAALPAAIVREEPIVAAEASAPGNDTLPEISSLSREQITTIVIDVVSEKTGYPIDMLTLEADLEADLSIDSIKKMEIIGSLSERMTFPDNGEDMDEFFERLVSIKTLDEQITWIVELGNRDTGATVEQPRGFAGVTAVAADSAVPSGPVKTDVIVRMTPTLTPRALGPTDAALITGKVIAVTDDGNGVAAAVAKELEGKGATVRLIGADEPSLQDSDGLIVLNITSSPHHYTTFDLVRLLKAADMKKLEAVFTFDDSTGALLDAEGFDAVDRLEGFDGLIKTLFHEYPGKRLGSVSFYAALDTATLPQIVADELCSTQPFPEILYKDAERLSFLPQIGELVVPEGEPVQLELDNNSHIIVLGGAQGITPTLVARLATAYPCQYHLVGRSDLEVERDEYANLTTVDEIRAYLLGTEDMDTTTLREVEAKALRVFKTNQVAKALSLIEETGATASYHVADVTNEQSLRTLIEGLKEEYGTIDGVIHAAGILEDKLFRDKEVASFERVYNTKAAPLKVIVETLLPNLKLLVMFSSMSSAFGNAGQSDYAAGNSVMDSFARILAVKAPQVRAIAFGWGPWMGAGMVNAGLEREFQKKGISFLRLDKGADFFVHEIVAGDTPVVLAIGGDEKELQGFISMALN